MDARHEWKRTHPQLIKTIKVHRTLFTFYTYFFSVQACTAVYHHDARTPFVAPNLNVPMVRYIVTSLATGLHCYVYTHTSTFRTKRSCVFPFHFIIIIIIITGCNIGWRVGISAARTYTYTRTRPSNIVNQVKPDRRGQTRLQVAETRHRIPPYWLATRLHHG